MTNWYISSLSARALSGICWSHSSSFRVKASNDHHIYHICKHLLLSATTCLSSNCLSVWSSKSSSTLALMFPTTFGGVSYQELGTSSPHVAQIFPHTISATWSHLSVYTTPAWILGPREHLQFVPWLYDRLLHLWIWCWGPVLIRTGKNRGSEYILPWSEPLFFPLLRFFSCHW